MPTYLVPQNDESHFKIAAPNCDYLYGYSTDTQDGAFTPSQFLAQTFHEFEWLSATRPHTVLQTLKYPFLALQVKAAGGAGARGDLWTATNECAGASAACLRAADSLDATLLLYGMAEPETDNYDNLTVSYAIAVDNNIAQVYVAWMERSEARPAVNPLLPPESGCFSAQQGRRLHGFPEPSPEYSRLGQGCSARADQGVPRLSACGTQEGGRGAREISPASV